MSSKRLDRRELFMRVAWLYAHRSSCRRARVGAVAVRDGRIIATGYVGAPSGMPHCLDDGCIIGEDGGCIRSVHAEANLIAWAARTGTMLEGTELYCTHLPCLSCGKLLANVGIRRVIFDQMYRNVDGFNLLRAQGVTVDSYASRGQSTLETDTQSELH